MINMKNEEWMKAQEWEREWHGDCANSFHEEQKQFVYAQRMGLDEFKVVDPAGRIFFDFGMKNIVDIGGGAYSLLLKSKAQNRTVIDPCDYPNWVKQRYSDLNIEYIQQPAEEIPSFATNYEIYDIALIYNCLQHTIDPKKIIENVKKTAREIRIFEWIETGTNLGHLHNLTEANLNKWLKGKGKVERINQDGCVGMCYYGIFPTKLGKNEVNCVCGQTDEEHKTTAGSVKHATAIARSTGISLKDIKV